jgi:metal-dependent HD superfamily phosphatase/phosphodiesterase
MKENSANRATSQTKKVTLEEVKGHPEVKAYIAQAEKYLNSIGYTEHGFRHASLVASIAHNILSRISTYPNRTAELAGIAGFLHDIGNVTGRDEHNVAGALLARNILYDLRADPQEIAIIMTAVGNHEEEGGWPTNEVSAALILADKSDVHRTRVNNPDPATFDIHDRVNYAAKRSFLRVDEAAGTISLEIEIDTEISQVMEYFEIFLNRMIMCRRSAEFLKYRFNLIINGTKMF